MRLRRLTYSIRQNAVAWLALFVSLGGTGAYAANTIGSADIIDGEVKAPDIAANAVDSARVRDNTLNTFDVHSFIGEDVIDGTLTSADIQNFSLGNGDFLDGSVDGRVATDNSLTGADIQNGQIGQVDLGDGIVNSAKVADNSLTGTDINESTLNLPQTPTTATFAGCSGCGGFNNDGSFSRYVSKTLPAGSWAVVATANIATPPDDDVGGPLDTVCELRNGSAYIGGATDSRMNTTGASVKSSLSMNGGAQVPAGGGEVSLYCKHPLGFGAVNYAQMMFIRLDGFF
jgi:hypothetical protein